MTATKTASKPEKTPKAKLPVLKPQLRILQAARKAGKAMTKEQIEKAADIPPTWVAEYLGGTGSDKNEVRGCKKLVPAGLMKRVEKDDDGHTIVLHEITAAGRKLLDKIK